jgi:dethiobiotin synthetase
MHRYRLRFSTGVGEVSDTTPTPVGSLRYWKPIQTGIETDDDTAEVSRLGACVAEEIFDRGVRLPRPLSPHLSARFADRLIQIADLVSLAAGAPTSDRWIVEGAGGVLVPLNESDLMIDLMVRLGLPVVVAARPTLGTINHTLLTIEALRSRSLDVAGVLMVGDANADNRDAIAHYGRVRILGEMPRFDILEPDTLEAWAVAHLDADGALDAIFRGPERPTLHERRTP